MKVYKVIGLMSGTSLDGLDMAYCYIWEENLHWRYEIKKTRHISYDKEMKTSLEKAIHTSALNLLLLNKFYGKWIGIKVKEFIDLYTLDVDFISSHGHTIHHRPELGVSYQLGCGQQIANYCKCKVVNNFRSKDISLKGQGAPLVPIGDELFFSEYDFCLNLGGISNISFQKNEKRVAYDIGMANMPLNYLAKKIHLTYDKNGAVARKGNINQKLLDNLNLLEYYTKPFPKSTGYEWFSDKIVPLIEKTDDCIENMMNTLVYHNCHVISQELIRYKKPSVVKVLITGGGANNSFFMEVLQTCLTKDIKIIIPNKKLIEYKEALVFALMGVLKKEDKINCLSSVTGAVKDSCSGVVYQ